MVLVVTCCLVKPGWVSAACFDLAPGADLDRWKERLVGRWKQLVRVPLSSPFLDSFS